MGDYGHSMLDPFVDCYFLTGYRPAWEAAERMAKSMAHAYTGAWRYISNPTTGLTRMYLETHDPFYKEQADRIWNDLCYPEKNSWWGGDHGDRMGLWYSQINPQCAEAVQAWALNSEKLQRFEGVDILTSLYLKTGEARYAEAVRKTAFVEPPNPTQFILLNLRAWCYAGWAWPEAGKAASPSVEAGSK